MIDPTAKIALETNLGQLKGIISGFGLEQKRKFNNAYSEIKGLIRQYGDEGVLALSLVSTELMLGLIKQDEEGAPTL
jgi:hypothetical protein